MINIKGYKIDNHRLYLLNFYGHKFLFISKPDISKLHYFNQVTQQKIGKVNIKLDTSYLQCLSDVKQVDYIVLTNYQEIIVAPYLLRKYQTAKILCTLAMFNLAKIYANDLRETVNQTDLLLEKLTFEDESVIYDQYDIEFGINLDNWQQIYSKGQLQECLNTTINVNYGQVYDTQQAIKVTAYPSGINLGSAVWKFQSVKTKQTLLFLSQISSTAWRHCQQFNPHRISQTTPRLDHIFFCESSLLNLSEAETDEQRCMAIMNKLKSNMETNLNSELILDDQLLLLDMIQYLSYQFRDKFRQLYILGNSLGAMIRYANSYIEYLSANYQQRIYRDPPQYPFQDYHVLKQKRLLHEGTYQHISERQKIPLKQLILRHTPFLAIVGDYAAHLNKQPTKYQQVSYKYRPVYSLANFGQTLARLNATNVYTFGERSQQHELMRKVNAGIDTKLIPYFEEVTVGAHLEQYFVCRQLSTNNIQFYTVQNGEVMASDVEKEFFHLSKDWAAMVVQHLAQKGIVAEHNNVNWVSTASTQLRLENYVLTIKSTDTQELIKFDELINTRFRKLKLK